jgi:hypothetical protein
MKTVAREIPVDKNLIAYCGLYCGACRSYLSGKCPGCKENVKATWCKVRVCCIENSYLSCADCQLMELKECRKFNNFFSKVIGLVLNSDRSACISQIREKGYDIFAADMAASKRQTIKRNSEIAK